MRTDMNDRGLTAVSVKVEAGVLEAWEAFIELRLGKKRPYFVCAMLAYMAMDPAAQEAIRQAYLDYLATGELRIPPLVCRAATPEDLASEADAALSQVAKKRAGKG